MAYSARRTIVFVILLLIPLMSARSQTAVDKPPTSTISGKITVGGKGISGVVVGLVISEEFRSNPRPTRYKSTTDEDGNYRITKVPPGAYDVIAASPAYVASEGRKSVNVGKNETIENIDIALERGGVITGKVTDDEGRPVIEETVYVSAVARTRVPYIRNIRTDDRGIYRAYGVPPGRYVVYAGTAAHSSIGNRRPQGPFQRTYHPSAVDLAAATIINVSDGSEATNVDITLGGPARTYFARGRVVDSETDKPLPNMPVGVQIYLQYGTSAYGNVAESNKNGEFKVEKLAPGKYAAYSQPPADSGWYSEAVQFEVTDRDVEGLVIKTFRGASVSGVVVLEGTDDSKVRANLQATRIIGRIADGYVGQSDPSSAINANGSFRLTGLAAGRLMIYLQPGEPMRLIRVERGGIVYPRGVDIKEHEQVTDLRVVVGYANGSIRGVIRLPADLELPVPARLRVFARRTEDVGPGSYGTSVEADARGHFRIDRLVPGTYEISVSVLTNTPPAERSSIPPTRQTVVVTNGAVADVTITLQIPKPAPQ